MQSGNNDVVILTTWLSIDYQEIEWEMLDAAIGVVFLMLDEHWRIDLFRICDELYEPSIGIEIRDCLV